MIYTTDPAPLAMRGLSTSSSLSSATLRTEAVVALPPRSKSNQSEDSDLRAALQASQQGPDWELVRDNARQLRTLCSSSSSPIDPDLLAFCVSECQRDQQLVTKSIERANDSELQTLLDLNGILLHALELAMHQQDDKKQPPDDVDHVAGQKDVFSLICMLRAQQSERRLNAALVLLDFVRQAEELGGAEDLRLRNEIRSTGGLQSLLTLFRSTGASYEVKVVSALAVAYLLPAFAPCETQPALALKILESLQFLSACRSVTPLGRTIRKEECFRVAAMALTNVWINQLEPVFHAGIDERPRETAWTLSRQSSGGRPRVSGAGLFDQRQEAIQLQELLEMTVSLIVRVARECSDVTDLRGGNPILLVEQLCAVEVARPIAVRESILSLLVDWINSRDRDKIQPAASALQYLTSIDDNYMAGWIHSQMISEGALPGIVRLTRDLSLGQDVRLAIAKILSSLCVAPHTRAAVVEADCVHFLIDILYDYTNAASQEATLFAASALLQLAAGAITRASVFTGDDRRILSRDKEDTLIEYVVASGGSSCNQCLSHVLCSDIVSRGAVASFIGIAIGQDPVLRSVAIEAIRVLSEDVSPNRQTRLQLCEDGAAMAIGKALKSDTDRLYPGLVAKVVDDAALRVDIKDLYEALCALANILEPVVDFRNMPMHSRQISGVKSSVALLELGCSQTAMYGGLESLIRIASLPVPSLGESSPSDSRIPLLVEASRSLASLAPLLISNRARSDGYSTWISKLLDTFRVLLSQIETSGIDENLAGVRMELFVNVLLGVGALANLSPMKTRIVDQFLPYIIQAKSMTDLYDLSSAASQAFQSLDLAEDEIATHVAGNSVALLADLYCLRRSLLLQALARAAIFRRLHTCWDISVGPVSFRRTMSSGSEIEETIASGSDLFSGLELSTSLLSDIRSLLLEYRSVYGDMIEDLTVSSVESLKSLEEAPSSLLSRQAYPLNSVSNEVAWILHSADEMAMDCSDSLASHVQDLLSSIFPSVLLRNLVLPMQSLRPYSTFDFRALMMPQRRYFSFRREGQLLARLCSQELDASESSDVHWTLGFSNSTYSGEFPESLVQALYLCPMIRGLSFSVGSGVDNQSNGDEGRKGTMSAALGTLIGSIPPWMSCVTFDGVLDDSGVTALTQVLETIGRLAESTGAGESAETQGKFCFLAVRRCPSVQAVTWKHFMSLMGHQNPPRGVESQPPLSCLKALDLSGNYLGDAMSAEVLSMALRPEVKCYIEQLDLSGNRISTGSRVLEVLRRYVETHRPDHLAGRQGTGRRWKTSLRVLRFAANGLSVSKMWLEVIALLKHNALHLESLDLSQNRLSFDENDYDCDVIVSALLKNTTLCSLDLSENRFDASSVDEVLSQLDEADTSCGIAFLELSGNKPTLTDRQVSLLRNFSRRSKKATLTRFLSDPRRQEESRVHGALSTVPTARQLDEPLGMGSEHTALSMRVHSSDHVPIHAPTTRSNMITVLFSAPLVFQDTSKTLRPFTKLDFTVERELLWQCLSEAMRDISLSFDCATHDRLLATMAKRCSCLHYSGHGHQNYLPFENGRGGPHWLEVERIKELIAGREGGVPFQFVFVSACHSGLAGRTFADAGVPHVVCCQQEVELKDAAALAFTRQFYLALAVGHTVRYAFDQGLKAVRATPHIREADTEMEKFVLLPKDGDHDVAIFDARPVQEWPSRRRGLEGRTRSQRTLNFSGTKISDLSVRNMIQEDPSPSPPQFFVGREIDMYYVLDLVLQFRLVSVVGHRGVGRSSLVRALCHYVNERASTMTSIQQIYFIRLKRRAKANLVQAMVGELLRKIVDSGRGDILPHTASTDEIVEAICSALKTDPVLIVVDRTELLSNDDNEFPALLNSLAHETRNVKVLLTATKPLGIPSLNDHPYRLEPLNFANTVRLFANLCSYLYTPEQRKKFFETVASDAEQAELLHTDPGLDDRTRKIFAMLGDGIPSQIEKAAYMIGKEDYVNLCHGKIE